jgi:hypothetical protein
MIANLETLLGGLIRKGTDLAKATSVAEHDRAATSIRLKPRTKHFIEHQANALGTSTQSVINMILDGVAESTMDATSGVLKTMRERFFYLFSAHRLDMPSVISVMAGHGFKLSDLENSARLLDLLDRDAIHHLAETFFVRPSWVSGAHDSPVDTNASRVTWYKYVHAAGRRLIELHLTGMQPHVMFIRRKGADFERARQDDDHTDSLHEPVGVVLRLQRQTSDGAQFTVYETWAFERWNYWRCREQLKLLITFCDQAVNMISFNGYEIETEKLQALARGQILPVTALDRIGSVSWYPDDYASIRDKVTKELEDWPTIERTYREGKYNEIIDSARQLRLNESAPE